LEIPRRAIFAVMLPSNFKWLETPKLWCLWCPPGETPIYVRKRDAAILIRWNGYTHQARAASVEQAKRHIGRWVAAQRTKPWGAERHRERLPDAIRSRLLDLQHEAEQEFIEFRPGDVVCAGGVPNKSRSLKRITGPTALAGIRPVRR